MAGIALWSVILSRFSVRNLAIPESRPLADGIGGIRGQNHLCHPLPLPPKSAILLCRTCVSPKEGNGRPETDGNSHRIDLQTGCCGTSPHQHRRIQLLADTQLEQLSTEFVGEQPATSIALDERWAELTELSRTQDDGTSVAPRCYRSIQVTLVSLGEKLSDSLWVRILASQSAAIAVLPNIGGLEYHSPDYSHASGPPRVITARR